jgi:hypothetical protein
VSLIGETQVIAHSNTQRLASLDCDDHALKLE